MVGVTQEIGIPIDLSSGEFQGTVYKDGVLQLIEVGVDDLGQIVYAEKGSWISDPIPIQDKIQAFKNVVRSIVEDAGTTIITSVAVSDDGFNWSEYVRVGTDGKILNAEVKRFAKVKVELFASLNSSEMLVDPKKYESEFIDTSNGIRIKRKYSWDMTKDDTWSDEGSLHRKKITRDDWARIDKISVVEK